MKIVLETSDYRFADTVCSPLGEIRWLVVTIGGKQFNVRREFDRYSYPFGGEDAYHEEIDKLLICEMEFMLTKALTEAAATVPDGPLATRPGDTA